MKLKIVSVLLSCLVNGQILSSGDGAYEILEEESSSGTIFDDPNFTITGRTENQGRNSNEEFREIGDLSEENGENDEFISISFVSTSDNESSIQLTSPRPTSSSSSARPTHPIDSSQNSSQSDPEQVGTETEMLVIGLAAGLGALLVVAILTITTCCIVHKRRVERTTLSNATKRPVESNPVEQTFERVDFNRKTITNCVIRKDKNPVSTLGDQNTISELAPSSMGTMRTFVQISNQKPVSHIAIDSDFRNTSSDVDSIESSNATSNARPPPKVMTKVIEKSAMVAKVNTYGYQELPTRDQSSHASYSTSNSSTVPSDHKIILEQKDTNYLPPYETITRSKDSVIDL